MIELSPGSQRTRTGLILFTSHQTSHQFYISMIGEASPISHHKNSLSCRILLTTQDNISFSLDCLPIGSLRGAMNRFKPVHYEQVYTCSLLHTYDTFITWLDTSGYTMRSSVLRSMYYFLYSRKSTKILHGVVLRVSFGFGLLVWRQCFLCLRVKFVLPFTQEACWVFECRQQFTITFCRLFWPFTTNAIIKVEQDKHHQTCQTRDLEKAIMFFWANVRGQSQYRLFSSCWSCRLKSSVKKMHIGPDRKSMMQEMKNASHISRKTMSCITGCLLIHSELAGLS